MIRSDSRVTPPPIFACTSSVSGWTSSSGALDWVAGSRASHSSSRSSGERSGAACGIKLRPPDPPQVFGQPARDQLVTNLTPALGRENEEVVPGPALGAAGHRERSRKPAAGGGLRRRRSGRGRRDAEAVPSGGVATDSLADWPRLSGGRRGGLQRPTCRPLRRGLGATARRVLWRGRGVAAAALVSP